MVKIEFRDDKRFLDLKWDPEKMEEELIKRWIQKVQGSVDKKTGIQQIYVIAYSEITELYYIYIWDEMLQGKWKEPIKKWVTLKRFWPAIHYPWLWKTIKEHSDIKDIDEIKKMKNS